VRTLFIYPEFPKTFWSYEKILELIDRKVLLPPLGLVTVAALLPQSWEMKLVDRNVRRRSLRCTRNHGARPHHRSGHLRPDRRGGGREGDGG